MFPGIGFGEILIIMVVAVLLFGRNLPSVARTVGNSYQQFRKGLSDIQANFHYDDVESTSAESNRQKKLPAYKDAKDPIDVTSSGQQLSAYAAPRFDIPLDEPAVDDSSILAANVPLEMGDPQNASTFNEKQH